MPRKRGRPTSRCRKTLLAAIAACAVCAAAGSIAQAQHVQMVKWDIEATVTDVVDPAGYFPDVRLGDPVHGTLQYDATLDVNPFYSDPPWFQTFTNYAWLPAVSMVIENPRSGIPVRFTPDESGEEYTGVEVVDDYEHDDGTESDWVFAKQPVTPPLGFTGAAPTIAVGLFAPAPTRADASLPTQLSLDDWPLAVMAFLDRFHSDTDGTSIEAEVYSMTPVAVAPGDFNANGHVDGADLAIWQNEFGVTAYAYGDGDADGDADGADFLFWQRQLGGNSIVSAVAAVPEPATLLTLLIGSLMMCSRRRTPIS